MVVFLRCNLVFLPFWTQISDVISFSSGLNLSPFFDNTYNTSGQGEKLVVLGPPEEVIEKVQEIVKDDGVRVKKRKDYGMELIWPNGKLVIGLEVFRLTEQVVVVEVRSRGGGAELYDEFWKNRIRPQLLDRRREAPTR